MKGLDFNCPIDKTKMEYQSVSDGYENNSEYHCLKCNFVYEMRSDANINEQAREYKRGILEEYRGLTPRGRSARVRQLHRELKEEAREKVGGLEKKVALMRAVHL